MSKTVTRATGLERIEVERLLQRVGRLFTALQEAVETVAPPLPGVWMPPVDLCESDEAIMVRIELPGVEVQGIEVALTNEQLRISGEKRSRVPRHRDVSHLCSERSYGRFMRVVPLRWTISVRDARAELQRGILTVRLPKLTDRRGVEFKIPILDKDLD